MIFIDSIVMLAVAVFGILAMFGIVKGSGIIKLFVVFIFGPVVLMLCISQLGMVISGLPVAPKIVLILVSPLIVMALLYWFFPKANWSKRLQDSIYNGYVAVLKAPLRAIRWAVNRLRGHP